MEKQKKEWEIALEKFLEPWKKRKEVAGALVCGSFITGNPSKHSDIDIHIILKKNTKWRERGNKIVDGYLIEYFANPKEKHFEYTQEDYKQRKKINAHMFVTGKVLFDKTGELKEIIEYSKKFLRKSFPKPDKIGVELSKYHLWDMQDNLEEVYEQDKEDFSFVYYNFLNKLIQEYSKFLGFESFPVNKTRRFLEDKKDKKKYAVNDFPDKKFKKMFLKAMKLKDKMMGSYKKLINYVLNKMGGFDINGWKIKSQA